MYVHVPFCAKKCYYCDFNSYTLDRAAVVRYLDALAREAALYSARWSGAARPFDTLFIGGGTPTCLAAKELRRLIQIVRDHFELRADAEITCEANPGSSNVEKYAALREAGVNRLSIGFQSLDDALLARLGRTHTAQEAVASFHAARAAGFDNVNIDLMFALPGQDRAAWRRTLEETLALEPEHLSCYSLIVEEGTPFGDAYARGRLTLPGEDEELAMFEEAIARAQEAGYQHYEISNFARPGYASRHNTLYWRVEPYLGLGPGAHGFVEGVRYSNVKLPGEYARRLEAGESPVAWSAPVSPDEAMDDVMIFGLRMLAGVERERFRRRFGVDVAQVYPEELARLEAAGLIEVTEERVRLTRRGLPLGNQVFAAFLRTAG